MSEIVQQCETICSLAWGAGNPDLSGIGANVSYIMQVVLVFLIGPVMCAIWKLGEQGYFVIGPEITEAFEDIRSSFMDVNGQFSISVAIAAVIRVNGYSASFFEIAFLQPLVIMQLLTVVAISYSVWSVLTVLTDIRRVVLSSTYFFLDICLVVSFQNRLEKPKNSREMLEQLIKSCEAYGSVKPTIYNEQEDPGVKNMALAIGLGIPVVIFLASLVLRYSKKVKRLFSNMFGQFDGFLGWFFDQSFGKALVALALVLGAIVLLIKMERKRTRMGSITGQSFSDDEWGFGQVIAVMLWIPFLVRAFSSALKCTTLAYRRRKFMAESRAASPKSSQVPPPASIQVEMGDIRSASQPPADNQPPALTHTEASPSPLSVVHEDLQLRKNGGPISTLKRRVGTV
ncbi:hypothetical protein BKA61DRAFT_683154 [Leptodontidium sp. MPI-SDFR-AT-0119]|nr:hypothetical protein BKA61DRAFT_683154 [Leptodontidium sp. MPI-SDFR-AT-0119]